jgi:hypothetical protein
MSVKKIKFSSRASVMATIEYGHAHLVNRDQTGDDTIYYSNCAVTIQTARSCVTVRPTGVIEQYVTRPAGKAVIQDSENYGLLAEFDANTICPVFHEMDKDATLFEPPFSFSFSDAEVVVAFEITADGDKIVYMNAVAGANRVVLVVKVCDCMDVRETEGASRCDSEEFSGWLCKSEMLNSDVQGQHVSEDFHFQPIY